MYCVECGHPIDEEVEFCPNCGARINKVSVETEDETPVSVVPSKDDAPSRKAPKLFIAIGAGVVILAALIMLLLNLGTVKAWFAGVFTSPEDLLVNVYKATANAVLEPVLQEYEKNLTDGGFAERSDKGQLLIKPGQQIQDLLAYAVYGGEGDMSWLSELRLDVDLTVKNELQKNVLGLGLGQHDILSLELITDSENKKQYISVPELSQQGLMMDMSQSANPQSTDMTKLYDAMPSAQVIGQLFDRYSDILLGGFSNVEKSKEEVTLGSVTQELTVLTAMIDETDMIEMTVKLLEQAKQDPDIKKILEDMEPWYQDMMLQAAYGVATDTQQSLYAEFVAETDAVLADLQEQLNQADPENQMYLYTYLDGQLHIMGIKFHATGMEAPNSFMTLFQGTRFFTEVLLDDMKLTGSGELSESLNSSYELFVDGSKMMDIRQENVTQTSGTVYLEPSASLMSDLAVQMGMDSSGAGMMGMADVVLCLHYKDAEESSNCSVAIVSNDVSILEIHISSETAVPQDITAPVNAVNINDEEALYNWLIGLDFVGLMENIAQAGVPEELFMSLLAIE